MCGICGAFEFAGRGAVDEPAVRAMLDSIVHRGPDEEGIFADGDVGFGTRRLSIIDLEGASQPLMNEDASIVVAFNGEIYNFRELQDGLRSRGHSLRSEGDGEVIAHLYEELGVRCVEELDGMFAFAVWDKRARHLLIARDRLGIKPLYYAAGPDRLVFGSEIKALLRYTGVSPRLDVTALGHFLALKYVPSPRTMFGGIASLPPGHVLECTERGVAVSRYWDVSFARPSVRRSEGEYVEELGEHLRRAVGSQLVSDVPFGAFLSGGVDSSTIVALMSGFLDQPVKTFAVGFEGAGASASELPFARMVAERYGTDHHEVLVTPSDLMRLAKKVVWHLDQPIADNACLPNYIVASLASQHVKMVLTGEGGDELFAGYARYAGERFAPAFGRLPASARRAVLGLSSRLPLLRRPKLALYALSQTDDVRRLVNWFPLFNTEMLEQLSAGELARAVEESPAEAVFAEQLGGADGPDALSRMLYVDTKLWLPDDLLARGDKMSMAASLEARVPLLDHRLVEFAATVPPNLKVRRFTRKY
ncbi:MAG TPA: asparagine synthase (glutamine-hydrolyzing), partial [Thermoleophilaceae bacterium]